MRHYCSLCHQWIADFRHVKQHFNKVHGPTLGHLLPEVTKLCKPFKSHLTRDRSCLWCSHKDVRGCPGPRAGGGHLFALLQRQPNGPHTHAGSLPEASSPGTPPETNAGGTSSAKADECRPGHVWPSHASATGHSPADEQGDLATRGNHCQATTGEVLRALHEERAGGDRPGLASGQQGVEQEKGGGRGSPSLSTPHAPDAVHAAGAAESHAERGCNRRRKSGTAQAGVADIRKFLGVSQVGSAGQAADPRPGSTGPAACRSHPSSHLDDEGTSRRHHPTLRLFGPAQVGDGSEGGLNLSPRGGYARADGAGDVRGIFHSDGELGDASHRSVAQEGQDASVGSGQTAGHHNVQAPLRCRVFGHAAAGFLGEIKDGARCCSLGRVWASGLVAGSADIQAYRSGVHTAPWLAAHVGALHGSFAPTGSELAL
eukprot:s2769_g6.t2